jgi:uncharacterized membrane protein
MNLDINDPNPDPGARMTMHIDKRDLAREGEAWRQTAFDLGYTPLVATGTGAAR